MSQKEIPSVGKRQGFKKGIAGKEKNTCFPLAVKAAATAVLGALLALPILYFVEVM